MRARALAALAALVALVPPAAAQPLEPPPEAPEGADYVIEPADSLAEGHVEVGVGASGRAGGSVARRQRLRFTGDAMSGTLREGSGDPLAGGSLDGRGRLGRFTAGRLSPRWGRGLVLGAPGDPWRREALDRGPGTPFRGRAGDGVMLRRGRDQGTEVIVGRFGGPRLAAARARHGGLALGALADGRGALQSSLAAARGGADGELVWDRAGRWRAEALLRRPLGPAGAGAGEPSGWSLTGRARAGAGGFASLAERARPGPERALAAALEGPAGAWRVHAVAALWRFRPGVAGARAGLAVERPLAHHGALALGVEEQRGARRDRGDAAFSSSAARAEGMRQGSWGEWWSGAGPMALGVRHERWGERPWARAVVRSVTAARLEARGPAGLRLAVVHSVFRARRGESLYLPESGSDRLVLRAVSGEGERTRLEARLPFAGGRARAALHLDTAPGSPARTEWTLDWTRRARLRGTAGGGE